MGNIYVTSDTHYGHKNIASMNGTQWKQGYRHYDSLEQMNKELIEGINSVVGPDDTLYHLGDWSFGGIKNIWEFRKQIECKDIHLILGNHDHHIEENKIAYIDSEELDLAHDLIGAMRTDFHMQEMFISISHYKEVKIGNHVYVLSHYGHRVWHGSHKGWIHLYGHSHDTLPPYGRSHDVGVDTAIRLLGKARPFHIREITDIIMNQPIQFPDHHDLTTNTGKLSKGSV